MPITANVDVAVTVIEVVADSLPDVLLTERFTDATGAKSLSVITTFCDVVLPNVKPDEGLLIEMIAVSVPSMSVSLIIENITDPVVCPSKMVIVLLLNV